MAENGRKQAKGASSRGEERQRLVRQVNPFSGSMSTTDNPRSRADEVDMRVFALD